MGIFDWKKTKAAQDTENPVLTQRRAPFAVDMTESIKINGELTRGLVHNTYPGYKLAGAMAYAPIHTPIAIIGVPIPRSENAAVQQRLTEFVQSAVTKFDAVHASSHGDGTIWVWPFFNTSTGLTDLELIIDDKISDVLVDITTGEIIEVISSEQITVQSGFGQSKIVNRVRSWTVDRIRDERDGVATVSRNPLGIMPVPFANEPDIGRMRGHSDLERIIPDLKTYHDVKLQWATVLAKMQPFVSQETENVNDWLRNNGFSSLIDVDKNNMDFIINLAGKEKTAFVFPQGAGAEYEKYLNMAFYAIVQGSSIPEIAWGLVSTGNHASSEEQMERLMSYCRKKQRQHTKPWQAVFRAVAAIEARANILAPASDITVEWNRLDALSETTKADIFAKVADSVQKMTDAGVPGEIIHAQLKAFYPAATIGAYDEFRAARQDAAKFRVFKDATYLDIIDAEGQSGL